MENTEYSDPEASLPSSSPAASVHIVVLSSEQSQPAGALGAGSGSDSVSTQDRISIPSSQPETRNNQSSKKPRPFKSEAEAYEGGKCDPIIEAEDDYFRYLLPMLKGSQCSDWSKEVLSDPLDVQEVFLVPMQESAPAAGSNAERLGNPAGKPSKFLVPVDTTRTYYIYTVLLIHFFRRAL